MERTTFNVQYATDRDVYPNFKEADVSIFYDIVDWWSDDDLARTLLSILENELRTTVYLFGWGVID